MWWTWMLGLAFGWGLLIYVVLALMGAGTANNLRGFRLKLFLACIFWPVTLFVLMVILAINILLPKKKKMPLFGFLTGRGKNSQGQTSLLAGI